MFMAFIRLFLYTAVLLSLAVIVFPYSSEISASIVGGVIVYVIFFLNQIKEERRQAQIKEQNFNRYVLEMMYDFYGTFFFVIFGATNGGKIAWNEIETNIEKAIIKGDEEKLDNILKGSPAHWKNHMIEFLENMNNRLDILGVFLQNDKKIEKYNKLRTASNNFRNNYVNYMMVQDENINLGRSVKQFGKIMVDLANYCSSEISSKELKEFQPTYHVLKKIKD